MYTQEQILEMERKERIRRKYRSMLNQLYRINSKLDNLKDDYKDFLSLLSSNVQIDGEMFDDEELNSIKSDIYYIKNNLSNNLISRVSRKI